jgi:hypothetical protein
MKMKKMLMALMCLTLMCSAGCGNHNANAGGAVANGQFPSHNLVIQKWAVNDIQFVDSLVPAETEAAAIVLYGGENWRDSLYAADRADLKDASITLDHQDNFTFEKIFEKEFVAREVDVLVMWRVKVDNPYEAEFICNVEGSPKFIGIFDDQYHTLTIKKGYINIIFVPVAPEEGEDRIQ